MIDLCDNWLEGGSRIFFNTGFPVRQEKVESEASVYMINAFGNEQGITRTNPPDDKVSGRGDHVLPSEVDRAASSSCMSRVFHAGSCCQFLSEDEKKIFDRLDESERAAWLIDAFSVRSVSSGEMSPVDDCLMTSSPPTAAASNNQDMSLRTLAWLASSPLILSSNFLGNVVRWQDQGEATFWQEDGGEAEQGREIRLVSHSGTRPPGSTLHGSTMQRFPRTGQTLQGLSNGVECSCDLGRMCSMQDALGVHPSIRSTCPNSSSWSSSCGCGKASREPEGGSTLLAAATEQGHRLGRSREELPRQTCQDQSTESRLSEEQACRSTPGEGRQQEGSRNFIYSNSFNDDSINGSTINSTGHQLGDGPCYAAGEKRASLADGGGVGSSAEGGTFTFFGGVCGSGRSERIDEEDDPEDYELTLNGETDYDLEEHEVNWVDHNFIGKHLVTDEKLTLAAYIKDYFEDYEDEIFACGGQRDCDRLDVLELCCESDSLLTTIIQKTGGKAERAGLFNGCDLTKASGRAKVRQIIAERRPKWIWVSYPCGATSPIQHLNEVTDYGWWKSMKRKQKSRKLLQHGNEILEEYVETGGNLGWEWPRYNEGWQLPEVRRFWQKMDYADHHLDGCRFGLRSSEGLHKKPWTIRTNRPGAFQLMEKLCRGDHAHAPTMGGNVAKKTGLYTSAFCSLAGKCMLDYQMSDFGIFGAESVVIDREALKTMTEQELERLTLTVLKLHRRCGHPSNRALVKTLAARNADGKMLAIAEQLKCDECQEGQFSKPSVVVSLEKEEKIWNTLQMDVLFFKHGTNVHHFLVMLDEASGFSISAELLVHIDEIHANVDTPSVIEGLEGSWFQYFGQPGRIRCDLEGAFRGRELESFCADRGIELLPVPAEHHQSTGDVERMVGELRHKIEVFLRNEEVAPRRAVYAMTSAHNHMARVGGFAPSQWAFGRQVDNLDNIALHTSEGTADHAMAENLALRLRAEKRYLELNAKAKISRAINSRAKPSTRYLPGDLVYYKRYKTPSDLPAHGLVDQPRMRISRWYGPGRVLACETRVQEGGTRRTAASTVWVISQGRLKKFPIDQLRHASERERLIAEQTTGATLPWTMTSLDGLIQKGGYDDHTSEFMDKRNPNKQQRRAQGRSRTPVPVTHERRATSSGVRVEPQMQVEEMQNPAEASTEVSGDAAVDGLRLLTDPNYNPLQRLAGSTPQPDDTPFLRQRRKHEQDDRPLHVKKRALEEAILWCSEEKNDFVYSVEIPMPENEAAWRKILKDPSKFAAKSVQKGAEVSWGKLDPQQQAAMAEAKQAEVSQWIQESVCKRYRGVIPASRLMKMRWVLTLKSTSDPGTAKCKARIVLLGFTDPDLESLQTSAPTMSRRSRQLALSLATAKRWRLRKADAKSAFLQGTSNQAARQIYAMPVPELAASLAVEHGEAVQLLKAAYGLVSAPREWFLEVNRVACEECGLTQLRSDPCLWVLPGPPGGDPKGIIAGHVDDFLIAGDELDPEWRAALEKFRQAFRWSPWEETPFNHCGVVIDQQADFSFTLMHDEYCTEIKQVDIDKSSAEVTDEEMSQCRAVLGAAQWRVIQTAPQHAAKLSWLQSALPTSRHSKDILLQVNKLCREIYSQRFISVHIKQLDVKSLDDLAILCWTDAAVGNRSDMSSTGGYFVGMTSKEMLNGKRGCVNPLSWRSGKLPRIARSSLSAEIQALAEGEQELMMLRTQWAEMRGIPVDLRAPHLATCQIPAAMIVDAKSVYDAVQKGETASSAYSMKEKYAALELMAVAENLRKQKTPLLWVSSDAQLADGLTKSGAQDHMKNFLQQGQIWNVKFDPQFIAAKKKSKEDRMTQSVPEKSSTPSTEWALSLIEMLQHTHAPFGNSLLGV